MDLFYAPPEDVHGSSLTLRGEEHKHLVRVLRKRVGDHIFVTDGDDTRYEAVVAVLNREECQCEIVGTQFRQNEPTVDVTLGVSLLKNPARFEFIVEKGTEHGVRSIVPLMCERTIGLQERQDRFGRIAIAAMKQSQRSYRPRIFPLTSLEMLAAHSEQYDLRLIPHERVEQSHYIGSLLQHHEEKKSVLIVVGPEGGFSDHELELASFHSFIPISLGPRRLRSETAAISAVSWVVRGT